MSKKLKEKKPIRIAILGEAPTTGDEAIAIGLCKSLCEEIPFAEFNIYAEFPEFYKTIASWCNVTVEKFPDVVDADIVSPLRRYIAVISLLVGFTKLCKAHPSCRKAELISNDNEAVFLQGGPGWPEGLLSSPRKLLAKLIFLKALRMHGCPVFSVGQSFGPWPKGPLLLYFVSKFFFKRIIASLSVIAPRDLESLRVVRGCLASAGIEGADTALGMTRCAIALKPKDNCVRRVGLCVRDFQAYYGHSESISNYCLEFSRLVDGLASLSWEIVWIATDYRSGVGKKSDIEMIDEILSGCKHLNKPSQGQQLVEPMHPRDILETSKTLDLIISTRLHPIILSATSCVPCISVVYDDKCKKFMDSVGMGKYAVSLQAFNCNQVLSMVDELVLDAPNIRNKIYTAITAQQGTLSGVFSSVSEHIGVPRKF